MKRVAILGSTGSIGTQGLSVIEAMPEELSVVAIAAGNNRQLLAEQARKHRPRLVAIADESEGPLLAEELSDLSDVTVGWGRKSIDVIASSGDVDIVLAAIVGAAGLQPVMSAVRAGKDVALANKESLVVAGALLVEEAERSGSKLLPVDSEHCALHQCLRGGAPREVERLVLTASGGPFLHHCKDMLDQVTASDALKHPRWSMGPKITVDSATLMNKGLEVIEAHWLFGIDPDRIEVVVHPESLVHSFVEFCDGSLLAQVSATDMTLPIQYALTWPNRLPAAGPRLHPRDLGKLEFFEPDLDRFPCLGLAWAALEMGGGAPAVLNAANEAAVAAFLEGQASFREIYSTVSQVLESMGPGSSADSLEALIGLDSAARRRAVELLAG